MGKWAWVLYVTQCSVVGLCWRVEEGKTRVKEERDNTHLQLIRLPGAHESVDQLARVVEVNILVDQTVYDQQPVFTTRINNVNNIFVTNSIDLYIDKIWKALSFSGTYSSMNTVQSIILLIRTWRYQKVGLAKVQIRQKCTKMHEAYTFKVTISIWVKNSQDKQTLL